MINKEAAFSGLKYIIWAVIWVLAAWGCGEWAKASQEHRDKRYFKVLDSCYKDPQCRLKAGELKAYNSLKRKYN